MAENPVTPEGSPQPSSKLKTTIIQGVLGAIALAGTTAIPILVKQVLEAPKTPATAPISSPAPAANPGELQQLDMTGATPVLEQQRQTSDRKKKKKDDDDDDD